MKTKVVIDDIGTADVIFYIEEALIMYIDYYKNGGSDEDKLFARRAEEVYDKVHNSAKLIKEYKIHNGE